MENDTLLKGVRIPEQGFIEIQISSDGNVILTGESVRYDDHDYYRPVGPALIGSAIPAVDAVEVVRCSDCVHFEPFRRHDGFCKIDGMLRENDFFCKYGKRREDGDGDD